MYREIEGKRVDGTDGMQHEWNVSEERQKVVVSEAAVLVPVPVLVLELEASGMMKRSCSLDL